ncbi:MAG TPA: PQQ-binding-like beta-propeller repeat protein [Thermomicrobiales bacterium]|nr:PQQ-binding-like beta-propeller repeat protein [Thermomicrobiales bacterium]
MSRTPRTLESFSRPTLTRRQLIGAAGAVSVAGLAGVVSFVSLPANAQDQGPIQVTPLGSPFPEEAAEFAGDWPLVHGDYKAHRTAESSTISQESIGDLDIAWRVPLTGVGYYGAITSPALILGDTAYFQDLQSNVFAVDLATGELQWEKVYAITSFGPGGLSVGYGMVYGATGPGGDTFALDIATGEEVWTRNLSVSGRESSVMAPTVYDSVVYTCAHEGYRGGSRGFLYALDAGTGDVLWRWDTSVDNLWGSARLNGGADIWYPASVDDDGNIYLGIGNPSPFPDDNGVSRPGPNLYSSSMVSLEPATGSLRWYVQAAPHDVLDHDFQQTPVLATVSIDGVDTLLAIGAGKVGKVIAADASTGEVVWEKSVGEHNEYGDGAPLPEGSPVTVLPGTYGGVESPMALSEGTLFVPVLNLPSAFSATEWVVPEGQTLADASSQLLALDVTNGEIKWQVDIDTFVATGATVTNDIVFVGGLDGIVHGYDTATGNEVWTYQAGGGLNAPFSAAGDTFFVPVGSPLYTKSGDTVTPTMELLAFRLGGNGTGTPTALSPLPSESAAAATPVTEPAPPPAGASEATPAAASGNAVKMDMVDIAFDPSELTISADTPTQVDLSNSGVLPHNFSIDELDISVDLAPGKATTFTIDAPAGTYEYYCNVPGHKDAGMVGTLTVK